MPQYAEFPRELTVDQLLRMMNDIRDAKSGSTDDRLIKLLGVDALLDKRIGTLSGGMRQKVSAVLAFRYRPNILVLDEPTAGLDPVSASKLLDAAVQAKRGGCHRADHLAHHGRGATPWRSRGLPAGWSAAVSLAAGVHHRGDRRTVARPRLAQVPRTTTTGQCGKSISTRCWTLRATASRWAMRSCCCSYPSGSSCWRPTTPRRSSASRRWCWRWCRCSLWSSPSSTSTTSTSSPCCWPCNPCAGRASFARNSWRSAAPCSSASSSAWACRWWLTPRPDRLDLVAHRRGAHHGVLRLGHVDRGTPKRSRKGRGHRSGDLGLHGAGL
ncbi:MAG: ATP-binding cassette domain-containing protein [Flavobacteriales bacterium]|nr:ATP-binding cassette domain-containing protein [Flavobacteriales bacterium]